MLRGLRLTVIGALVLVANGARGLEVSIPLTEQLGVAWKHELVRFDLGDAWKHELVRFDLGDAWKHELVRFDLGDAWKHELVRFDLGDAGSGCTPQSLRLEGPRGPLPAQLTADGQVAAIVDLEAGGTDTYTIRCDGSAPAPQADLQVLDREGGVEVKTRQFAARWNLGASDSPARVQR